jgi:hypothetical protein
MKNVAYDPVKDFAPVTRMGSYTLMLVIHPSIPAKSVRELIVYAKANPGKLSFASGNTSGVVAGETLKRWAEIDMLHVPYKSAPPAINDVLAGRVSMMFTDLTTGLPSGGRAALAVTRRGALADPELDLDEAASKAIWIPGRRSSPGPTLRDNHAAQRRAAQIIGSADVKSSPATRGLRGVLELA